MTANPDQPAPKDSQHQSPDGQNTPHTIPYVVGVGASAGGLQAIITLLENLPPDPGMALVIIQHLDPTRPSSLVEILGKKTDLPIEQVDEQTIVQPNHIYIISPGHYLALADGCLEVTVPDTPRGSRMAIDFFFESLAVNARERAIGVILSGTGTDGTVGLREIKQFGGLAVIQDPEEAAQPGMPQSALRAVDADYTLRAKDIGPRLKAYVDFHRHHALSPATTRPHSPLTDITPILDILAEKAHQDFRRYRKNTLERRIHRRMGLLQLRELSEYAIALREHPRELNALRRDLLIGVTRFFRDDAAWLKLASAVDKLLAQKVDGNPLRVWSVGCATGEEAYSLAMLLHEQTSRSATPVNFQVFATDIAEDALEFAREGLYPDAIAHDMSVERLRQFFVKEAGGYRISKRIRDCVLFANQNILTQAPFYNLDIILCRNLLIYLNRDAQDLVLDIFQFALKEGGLLMLGKTESVSNSRDLFAPISKTHRLFRRTNIKRRAPVGDIFKNQTRPPAQTLSLDPPAPRQDLGLAGCVQRQLFRQLDHAVAVVNRTGKLLFVEGRTDLFLKLHTGVFSAELPDLLNVLRRGMKEKLRKAIATAWVTREPISVKCKVQRQGGFHDCSVQINHLLGRPEDQPALLLTFTPTATPQPQKTQPTDPSNTPHKTHQPLATDDQTILEIEQELAITRDQLNSSVAELESANEQLKASNEEAMTMNEELQSSNEELETSKEELQSLNEELTTLNNQLELKLTELQQSTNDLENFIRSSDVPTLFLDAEFRIRRFTPSFSQLFNLLPGDSGRPLADLRLPFDDPTLVDDAHAVLRDLQPREHRLFDLGNDRTYTRRMLPYRTDDNRILGVVITLTDVTELANAQRQAEEQLAQNRIIYASAPVGLAHLDKNLRIERINDRLAKLAGAPTETSIGKPAAQVLPATLARNIRQHQHQVLIDGQGIFDLELTITADETPAASRSSEDNLNPPAGQRDLIVSYVPLKNQTGEVWGINVVVQEITELKQAHRDLAARERELTEANRRLEAAQSAGRIGLWEWNQQTDQVTWSTSLSEMLGYQADQFPTNAAEFWSLLHEDDRSTTEARVAAVVSGDAPVYEAEFRMRRPTNDYTWVSVRGIPCWDEDGTLLSITGASVDITARKQHETQQRELLEDLRRILDHQLTCVLLLDRAGKAIEVNRTLLDTSGYAREQFVDNPAWLSPLWQGNPTTQSELQTLFDEAVAGKRVRRDLTGTTAAGEIIHFDFMLAPIYDDDGTIIYVLASATDINARKEAEQQLLLSEKRYRALVDATAEFVWTTNPLGQVEEDSPSWRAFTGQTFEEYLGSGWLRAIHPDDRAASDKAWRDAVAKKSSFTCEYRVRRREGFYQWVSARAVPVLDEHGDVSSWVGLNVNIQPYRDLAAAVQENKDRLAAALIAANAGSWEATPDTIQFDAPLSTEQAHGVTPREPLTLEEGLASIHPKDREHVEQAIRTSLAEQTPLETEYRLEQPDGSFRWILSKANFQSDGDTPRLVGFFQDITERKQVSLRSAANERRLAAALDGGKMGLWEWDAESNTCFWNKREYELLGLEPGDGYVPASLFVDHIHPDDQAEMQRFLDEVLKEGDDFSNEFRIQRADGEVRWLAALGKIERDHRGKIQRVVGINFDITEQKQIAETLRESDQRKDQFLATLAHELRNPLAPLRSGLEILRTCGDNPAAIDQTLHTMDRQLAHMVALVDDLLDVSRISRGKLTLRNQRVCVQKLIHEAIDICKPLIEAANHLLSLQMPAEELFVQGDPHRLSQVISNVVNNATKFTPPGGKIDVAVTKIDDQVEITVHDNGRGIAPSRLDDVFTMFVQSDETATHGYSGLGIGLSLVKKLVEMHHGSVRLTSPGPDQGTTLTVCLPLADTPALTTNAPPPSTTTTATPQLKVLVVDDNQAAADSLSLLLKVWGHDVRTADNGKLGVELASQYAPNLILMDIGMPIMDGNAAAKAIRSEPWGKHIHLVAISGWGQTEDIQRTTEAGFDRHLVKPVDPKVLVQLINDLAKNTSQP